jgi:dTDP-4-dehydrorhamnose 3,5-epimerase
VPLPADVQLFDLVAHHDARGTVVEVFQSSWFPDFASTQWTVQQTAANVVRGVHCHQRRTDYVVAAVGVVRVVLADARPDSSTFRLVERVTLDSADPQVLLVPVGVAHAFETISPATVLVGLDTPWDPADEFGCSWTDPVVRSCFEVTNPVLSERDAAAGSFDRMVELVAAAP